MKRALILALVGAVALSGCGGGGDDTATNGASDKPAATTDTKKPADSKSKGITVPLKAGSSAEVEPPELGKVKITLTEILSPADELLATGLTVTPGFQLWAFKAAVQVSGGKEAAIADYTVETAEGNEYPWTGTASAHDLGYNFVQGSTTEGYVAFEVPEKEKVVRVTASFSIYAGYDIFFQN